MAGVDVWKMVIYSFQRGFIIVILLAAILFCCFGWTASTMMHILGKEIKKFISSDEDQQIFENIDVVIAKWNRHYFMAIDFVHQFNRCFGCLLLVLIAPIFIRVISTSFYLMIELKDGQWTTAVTLNLIVLLVNFAAFILAANIPHRIRQEVQPYLLYYSV